MNIVTLKSATGRCYQVGYDPATRVLRIAYPNDRNRAYECIATADEFAGICAARSVGEWLNANLKGRLVPIAVSVQPPFPAFGTGGTVSAPERLTLVGETPCEQTIKLREPRSAVTQTFEAEGCCYEPISKALADGKLDKRESWCCPICGAEYRPHM